jgi:hypothetical protein
MYVFALFVFIAVVYAPNTVSAFRPMGRGTGTPAGRTVLKASLLDSTTQFLAELYSGPAATYNGELISESLKVVPNPEIAKSADYVYGAVSADATPLLASCAILSVFIAAAVPFILSVGESAQAQQREREESNRVGTNQFAIKARQRKGQK